MVEIITRENMAFYGDILDAMHKMRYRVAVEQWGWNIPGIEPGFDKDKFDTDETIYFICLDASETQVLACGRLNPTTKPHLLSEVFAEQCVSEKLPRSPAVFEFSRYVVDHQAMSKIDQAAVRARIPAAINKFCLDAKITHLTFLGYMSSYARTIKYWDTRPLGTPCYFEEDDATYIAAQSAMTAGGLKNLRDAFHLTSNEPYLSSRINWSDQPAINRIKAAINNRSLAA